MFSLSTLGLNSVPFVTGVTHQINPRKHTQIIPNITDARHVSSLYIYIFYFGSLGSRGMSRRLAANLGPITSQTNYGLEYTAAEA
jgi:hypothetical protein